MSTERFSQNVAAVGLAFVTLAVVAGVILLAARNADIPDVLQVIGGSAVGALGAQLARTPNNT